MKKKLVTTLAAALLVTGAAGAANAEVMLAGSKADPKAWSFSSDGFMNAFYIYETGNKAQPGTTGGLIAGGKSSSIRTGLLPCLIAFNMKAPTYNGIDISGRVGFYPQIQDTSRITFNSQIDTREVWFAADAAFGQVLIGKALNLFQGKSILTDMTLFGVGVQGGPTGGGTTLGHIGTGYLYAEFSPTIRYTTPDFGGLKAAVGLVNPSNIGAATNNLQTPAVEAEVSYAAKMAGASFQTWVNGIYQNAKAKNAAGATTLDIDSRGVSGGVQVGMAGAELQATGYTGKGIGSTIVLDGDAIDVNGRPRVSYGYLLQGTYKLPGTGTKVGANYGISYLKKKDAADVSATGLEHLKYAASTTVGVYQNITPVWQVMAEYTHVNQKWQNSREQVSNIYTVGSFFFW